MTDRNYQSVQYVVTNIPESTSDSAVKRNIQKSFDVQVCEFVRLPDATAGLITFEDQRDASKVVQMKPSIQKQPLNFNAMCYESTSLCLQGPVIEMVGIQTLVQMANDLVLACNVESDKITVHGYWKSVELYRNEANSLFQSFAGQTFTRLTGTAFQMSTAGSTSIVPMPKYSTSIHLPARTTTHSVSKTTVSKTTASQSVTSTVASSTVSASVTGSVDRLFTSTKVTHTPATFSTVTSTVSTSSMQTRIGLENPATGKGRSLAGGVQVYPLQIDLIRVTPEVSSTTASVTATTSSTTHASLSSAGIFLTTSSHTPLVTTTKSITSALPQTGVTLTDQRNSLETSNSELLKSPVEVKSKLDTIKLPAGQIITLKQGDIIKEAADVIVNPANSFLKHEGGVAKAIDNASDGLVQLFSDELVARDGVVPVGGAKYTQAGGQLRCKYVVHTVGPDAGKHAQRECETLLRLSCENSLILADALKATSVAFPAISAGIYSVDAPTVAKVIIKGLIEYKYPPTTCLKDIRIVINDYELFNIFKAYFAKKRKSLGKSRDRQHSSSSRAKSTPMVADHTVTAAVAAAQAPRSSVLTSSISTTIPSYTFPSRSHHRTGSLDLDSMMKTKSGATGFTHSHDQLT